MKKRIFIFYTFFLKLISPMPKIPGSNGLKDIDILQWVTEIKKIYTVTRYAKNGILVEKSNGMR